MIGNEILEYSSYFTFFEVGKKLNIRCPSKQFSKKLVEIQKMIDIVIATIYEVGNDFKIICLS